MGNLKICLNINIAIDFGHFRVQRQGQNTKPLQIVHCKIYIEFELANISLALIVLNHFIFWENEVI